jgi:ABC-type multidrug transport system fused ATPase/permease subunit
LTNLAFSVGAALLVGLAFLLFRQGSITLGTTVVLFQYTQLIRQPLERIIDQLQQLQAAQAGAARATELLAIESSLPAPKGGGAALPVGALAVDLDRVSFAYADDNQTILHDIDLHVPAGQTLGLVGRSGGGKTSIARLVLRLFDPTDGVVRIGGVDARAIEPASLRRRVAVVTQDVHLFPSTVRDNVTLFGALPGDDDAVAAALDELGLSGWAAGLHDGLDTDIAEAGLSAGEAQLISLARALLTDPGLVVLDEASSRLDPGTESRIEEALDRLLVGRTALVIAHRLSSLDRVDAIAVVEGGRVVEHGPRAKLVADPLSRFAQLRAAAGSSWVPS